MRIAIVGNAKSARGFGPLIDSHDLVVRFNLTPYYGSAGYRTDVLAIHNFGTPGRELVSGITSLHPAASFSAKNIWFVMHPDAQEDVSSTLGQKIEDHAVEIAEMTGAAKTLPASTWFGCKETLRRFGASASAHPSSGAMVLHYLTASYPDARFRLFGFSHRGWRGHPWQAERAWIDSLPNVRRVEWPSLNTGILWARHWMRREATA